MYRKTEIIKNEELSIVPIQEKQFYEDVREILLQARELAYKNASSIMTQAYWHVGERIVEQELLGKERSKYGSYLIKNLSKELSDEFGTGFSVANLKNCRQFYLTFPQDSYGYRMMKKVPWSHLRNIMRISDEDERNFYLDEVANENWSVRELERNIKSGYYKRMLSTQLPNTENKKLEFVKDPFVLEFMGVKQNDGHFESDIEKAIITNLQKFLLEMGKGFSFVGRQMRICTETTDFYIDLVFYNYILKCFVLIDLKNTKLTHQDIGQMDMYVRMFDDLKRTEDDNPTIGIIFCTDKDETMVKYSVLHENQQIFASKYMIVLPTVEELKRELERNQLIYNKD
ncbi:PDDEXK nuclease domain-containing protein [Floccifex sp.]|uniref:PDDEXK nuclease domain-containing protein n=1 Tax=Floccifex sp. TaxID=2815810 RepID=UPI003F092ACD